MIKSLRAATVVLLVACALTAGCGGSSAAGTSTSTSTTTAADTASTTGSGSSLPVDPTTVGVAISGCKTDIATSVSDPSLRTQLDSLCDKAHGAKTIGALRKAMAMECAEATKQSVPKACAKA
jgi:hypothetical protein